MQIGDYLDTNRNITLSGITPPGVTVSNFATVVLKFATTARRI